MFPGIIFITCQQEARNGEGRVRRGGGGGGGGGGGHAWVDIVKSNLPKFFSIRKVEESINNS